MHQIHDILAVQHACTSLWLCGLDLVSRVASEILQPAKYGSLVEIKYSLNSHRTPFIFLV